MSSLGLHGPRMGPTVMAFSSVLAGGPGPTSADMDISRVLSDEILVNFIYRAYEQ